MFTELKNDKNVLFGFLEIAITELGLRWEDFVFKSYSVARMILDMILNTIYGFIGEKEWDFDVSFHHIF